MHLSSDQLADFRKEIILWGKDNFRAFPWRLTVDPYRVLIAELLLHRTQVSQVLPVYEEFIRFYPNVSSLARAGKREINKKLGSLGLHWRTQAMLLMAKILVKDFGGQIPVDKKLLLSLPGVGDYIASAVRCFAWNIPEPLIDTNTVRITGRLFGLVVRDSSRRNRVFKDLIALMLDTENPRAFNYALLDLADKLCVAKGQPRCELCPVLRWCSFPGSR